MCLILFALDAHPQWPLILIANRDEFYARPTEKAHFWKNPPDLLAGRDLQAGGTWMGIRKQSLRLAAITNYRDLSLVRPESASRGNIVHSYLESDDSPVDFIEKLRKNRKTYNPFNLICGTTEELFCFFSVQNRYERILPGIHGLSNRILDSPWPKLKRGCDFLEKTLKTEVSEKNLLSILKDRQMPQDKDLPDTGIGLEWERALSSIFIQYTGYGTRSSTILLCHHSGGISFTEVSWNEKGEETETVRLAW